MQFVYVSLNQISIEDPISWHFSSQFKKIMFVILNQIVEIFTFLEKTRSFNSKSLIFFVNICI